MLELLALVGDQSASGFVLAAPAQFAVAFWLLLAWLAAGAIARGAKLVHALAQWHVLGHLACASALAALCVLTSSQSQKMLR